MFEVTEQQIADFRASSSRIYLGNTTRGNTIGVQSERMLHQILKYYLVPDESCHEIKVGRYHADAMVGRHIYEIQTRRFDRLHTKLTVLLQEYDVTVVYPVAAAKTISWVDPEDGSLTKPRKSRARRTIYDACYELYAIRDLLTHPRLHFRCVLCEMEEFRALTGYGKDRKKRAPRLERIPTALVGEAYFDNPRDYACLIPDVLGQRFTTPAFAREVKLPARSAWCAIQLLSSLGLIREAGREGRAKLWERQELPCEEASV